MSASPQQIEAIKLIGDWSKWIATTETAAIAVIGALMRESGNQPTGAGAGIRMIGALAFGLSILCFVISVLCAAMVLVSLPAAVQDIPSDAQETPPKEAKVWERTITWGEFNPLLRHVVEWQFNLFFVGILAFGLGVIVLILIWWSLVV